MLKMRVLAERELGLVVGCSDHNCAWGGPVDVGTNGGCQCVDKEQSPAALRSQFRRMSAVANLLARKVSALTPDDGSEP